MCVASATHLDSVMDTDSLNARIASLTLSARPLASEASLAALAASSCAVLAVSAVSDTVSRSLDSMEEVAS